MSERWKPKEGEQYWIIAFGEVVRSGWRADSADLSRLQRGNCFKTKEEAEAAAEKVKALLLSLHDDPTIECNQLPKLTAEVFNLPDCPEWAKWAAVDQDGVGSYFESKPLLLSWCPWWDRTIKHCRIGSCGKWDASDWQNSLIERPAKLPDWCKVDAVGWHKRCGYFKVTYIDDVSKRVDIQQVEDKSKGYLSFHTVCNETVHARPRPYNEAEMKALVGKVLKHSTGEYLVTAFKKQWDQVKIESVWRDPSELAELWTQLDDRPCAVLEHLNAKGEWVE